MRSFSFAAEKGIDSDNCNVRYVETESSPQSELSARKHTIEKMPDNLIDRNDEDYKNIEIVEENPVAIISGLFQDAIVKLAKIDAHAKQQKKQIIVELAKSLEGIIPTDVICMKIIKQLLGRVSDRFIRECLDEKYKQKPRIENARKQKKQKQLENKKDIDKLAAVTPLNQSLGNDKIILVGAHGREELAQSERENNDKPYSEMYNDSTEDNIKSLPHKLSYQKEIEQQSGPENKPLILKECTSCIELYYKNNELRKAI